MTAIREAIGTDERALHAYHDGELGWLARWRFERRLARSPELRRELDALAKLGELARQADAEAPTPDLWGAIVRRLTPAPQRAEAVRPGPGLGLVSWLPRPLVAAAAVALVAVALAVGLRPGETQPVGVVRSLDTGARSVLVLEGEADATIIWLLDGGAEEAARGDGREVA